MNQSYALIDLNYELVFSSTKFSVVFRGYHVCYTTDVDFTNASTIRQSINAGLEITLTETARQLDTLSNLAPNVGTNNQIRKLQEAQRILNELKFELDKSPKP